MGDVTLGEAYERGLDPALRRRLGAYYTPAPLAQSIAEATLAHGGADTRVCDPAVGGGALLVAAARVLLSRGADPVALAQHQLAGADIDPGAVAIARTELRDLLGHEPRLLRVADSLDRATWPEGTFDAVVTNPPFLGQLQRRTVRSRDAAAVMQSTWGSAAKGYADAANLFLLLALDLVGDEGRVGIVLPEPLLAARDARTTRQQVGAMSTVERLWRPGLGAFDAGIRVFVAVVTRTMPPDDAWSRGDWGVLAAADVPACEPVGDGVIGDIAAVTADFRDQYYGVTAVARDTELGEGHALVTCGLIDPARLWWGERSATLARTRMRWPRARVDDLDPRLQRWAKARLVPKLLVATQTRVLEAAADEAGTLLPVVPVISVVPPLDRIWHVLAALLAPPVAAAAHRAHTGSALSADAIKLSARQVAALPLPAPSPAWDRGAACVRRATIAGRSADASGWRDGLDAMGHAMCEAYRVEPTTVLPWWSERVEGRGRRHAVGS
ncbi:MAG: HsdM family class I SAM-dependent methyltransferase [Acidimicrobiales bacterium]